MSHCPAARYKVDSTVFTTVAICLVPGCGARWLTDSPEAGLSFIAAHVDLAHPGYENVPARHRRAA